MPYPPSAIQTVLPVLPVPSLRGRGLDWLKAMVVNPTVALDYLEFAELHLTLRLLYQFFFPMEFHLSTASRHWEPEHHSEEELEFFDLIHERLFYLPIECDDSLCTGIPICSINPDYWYEEYDWAELQMLEQMLMGLTEQVEWTEVEQTFPALSVPTPIARDQIHWRLFKQNCDAAASPLNYFPDAVQLLERDTGNPFLDNQTYEYVDYWDWSVNAIAELTHYYRKAVELQQQVQFLANWLADDPHRITDLIKLWNHSAKTNSAATNFKANTLSAPLIQILT